ncbi:hypothetical protein KCU73_g3705, partial [Aureobasidium melanogenum]
MTDTAETKNESGDKLMDKLRRELDDLNTDLLAERPEDWDKLDGVAVYQDEPEEENEEIPAESEQSDPVVHEKIEEESHETK